MSERDGMRLGVSGRSASFADKRSGPEGTDFSDLRDSAELRDAEQNARRALGLMPGGQGIQPGNNSASNNLAGNNQGRNRRRFARDGDVAVVVLPRGDHPNSEQQTSQSATSPPVNRLVAAEAARDSERSARQRAERALAEAQAALRNLQTQVQHAAMTHDEALENARRALADRDALEAALAAERQGREVAEQALAKILARRQRPAQLLTEPGAEPVKKKPARAKGRTSEPKPVKWWVKPRA